jgi:hypothetical protein
LLPLLCRRYCMLLLLLRSLHTHGELRAHHGPANGVREAMLCFATLLAALRA